MRIAFSPTPTFLNIFFGEVLREEHPAVVTDGELVFPAGAIGELDALLLSFVPRLAGADEPLTGFGEEEYFFVERRCGSLQFEEEDEFGEHGEG